jgi:hypothetical protein
MSDFWEWAASVYVFGWPVALGWGLAKVDWKNPPQKRMLGLSPWSYQVLGVLAFGALWPLYLLSIPALLLVDLVYLAVLILERLNWCLIRYVEAVERRKAGQARRQALPGRTGRCSSTGRQAQAEGMTFQITRGKGTMEPKQEQPTTPTDQKREGGEKPRLVIGRPKSGSEKNLRDFASKFYEALKAAALATLRSSKRARISSSLKPPAQP